MPKVTLTFPDEATIPAELKAFKTSDNKVEVWVGDKVAEETNAPLVANRDAILAEKNGIKDKYDALVKTSSADDIAKAKLIADAENKARTAIPEDDKKILDAVKKANPNAKPEEIEKAIKEFPVVSEKLTLIETQKQNSDFFQATGFKNERAFQKAIADKEANPNLIKHYTETKTENGKEVTVAYADVKKVDGTTEKVLFADYVKNNAEWETYKPALELAPGTAPTTQTWLPATQHQFQAPTNGQPLPVSNALAAVEKGMAVMNNPKTPAPDATAKT